MTHFPVDGAYEYPSLRICRDRLLSISCKRGAPHQCCFAAMEFAQREPAVYGGNAGEPVHQVHESGFGRSATGVEANIKKCMERRRPTHRDLGTMEERLTSADACHERCGYPQR